MEITNTPDAVLMLGHIMRNLRNIQDAVDITCQYEPELLAGFTEAISTMYCQLSEVSNFLVDPDIENSDAGNHVID